MGTEEQAARDRFNNFPEQLLDPLRDGVFDGA
jgi:hypothetical protein